MSRSQPNKQTPTDESYTPPEHQYWIGKEPAKVQWSKHPADFPGKMYPEWELMKLGEGDRDTRIDADYFDNDKEKK